MDTPNNAGTALPLHAERTFYPGTNTAAALLKDPFWFAAKWGNFTENPKNANGIPDQQSEWDTDLDGVPDSYYYVTNPLKLEQQLSKAFADLDKNTSSGTAASVLATNTEGSGSTVQAYFLPKKDSADGTVTTTWRGYLEILWMDPWGNLREDSDEDGHLDLQNSSDTNAVGSFRL